MSLLPYLEPITEKRNLTTEQAREAMLVILGGQSSQPQLAAFMIAMRMKGETVEEMVGFARAMREMAVPVEHGIVGQTLLDTCGTGGDCAGTFNISTVAAFVVAGAGVHVAKHGNRSVTNRAGCGSADLLESFGIDIALPPAESARAIREVGIGFLFAPHVHTAMKHANPVRVDLKVRTFFNLLGPLTNPAGASAQLVGVPTERAAELIAGALASLGLHRGFVVHGWDGLDEITTTGPTLAYEIHDGKVTKRSLEPEDFAVRRASADDLKGGDQARNLEIANAVLDGARGPHRDVVLVNAAAALLAAGKVDTFLEGMAIGTVSIDSGAARRKVAQLAEFTRAK
jgi:anthranilate phosphoribosyltransferase